MSREAIPGGVRIAEARFDPNHSKAPLPEALELHFVSCLTEANLPSTGLRAWTQASAVARVMSTEPTEGAAEALQDPFLLCMRYDTPLSVALLFSTEHLAILDAEIARLDQQCETVLFGVSPARVADLHCRDCLEEKGQEEPVLARMPFSFDSPVPLQVRLFWGGSVIV